MSALKPKCYGRPEILAKIEMFTLPIHGQGSVRAEPVEALGRQPFDRLRANGVVDGRLDISGGAAAVRSEPRR
jgi:hypothetical protein